MGPERPHLYTHDVVGGGVAVATLLGAPEKAELARERLRAAARLEVEEGSDGQGVTLTVRVTKDAGLPRGRGSPRSAGGPATLDAR